MKFDGSFVECYIWGIKRIGDMFDGLFMYSRRKLRGKFIGVRIDGFLVYIRKKIKLYSIFYVE